MTDADDKRVRWIIENILPHERKIRVWLSHRRIRDLDVDDVIQEMYAKIGAIQDLETIHSPKSYAFRVAYSIVLNHLRRPQIVSVTPHGELEKLDAPSLEASPEETVAFRDEMREVAKVIDTLPPRTREVFLLRRISGLSQRETAGRLNVSEKAIEKHMTHAVHTLTKYFGKVGKNSQEASSNAEGSDD